MCFSQVLRSIHMEYSTTEVRAYMRTLKGVIHRPKGCIFSYFACFPFEYTGCMACKSPGQMVWV